MKRAVGLPVLMFAVIAVTLAVFLSQTSTSPRTYAQSAYPPPESSVLSLPPAPYPAPEDVIAKPSPTPTQKPVIVTLSILVSVEGLENQDVAELELLPDTEKTSSDVMNLGIQLPTLNIQNESKTLDTIKIPIGAYKLVLSAPESYLREPQGYLFVVTESGIVRSSGLPFHFQLIPPSAQNLPPCRESLFQNSPSYIPIDPNTVEGKSYCQAERLIDISSPPKRAVYPVINNANYYYSHIHDQGCRYGVWGRSSVVDPNIGHDSDDEHVVNHVYATYDYNKWIEAGWAEKYFRDDRQYIFEFDSVNSTWNFYETFVPSPGDLVEVSVINDGGTFWKARVLREGRQIELARVDVGFTCDNNSYHGFEFATVLNHLVFMPLTHFDRTYLFNGTIWDPWDTDYDTTTSVEADPNYSLDMIQSYHDFVVHSPFTFIPLIRK